MPINNFGKMEALEIEDELIEAIQKAGVEGITIKQGAALTGMDYGTFHRALNELVWMGRVKIGRSHAGCEYRLVLPGWDSPAERFLTDKQTEVLDLLCSAMNKDKIARVSFGEIVKRTSCRCASNAIDALDRKGYLKVVERGTPRSAQAYKVYRSGNGPRGYSWTIR